MILGHCELHGRTGHEAGRELLAELYRQETGAQLPEILTTEKGKPYFPDSPYHFSISHTKHHAFCALSRRNVGLDAEELDRKVHWKLAEKIFSPMEMQQYEEAMDKARAFLTFWVLKEAEAKLTGEGLRVYPDHTNFSLDDPRVTQLHGCLVAVMEEGEDYAV